jgi:phage regulator Rha-like protein
MNSKYHNKRGRFVNLPVGFPIDIDAYDDKKEQATQRVSLEKNAPKVRDVIKVSSNMRNYILPKLVDLFDVKGVRVTHSELATLFEVERSVITESLNKLGIYKNNNGFMIKNLRKSDLDLVEGGE